MEIKLHDIGEGMTEAEINCFLVKPGDIVKADEPLVEVQTDKMIAEIPAPKTGIIRKLTVGEGDTVAVGTTLLILETVQLENHHLEEKLPLERNSDSSEEQPFLFKNHPSIETEKPFSKKQSSPASPYTRKIARENGINLEDVQGSGSAGRVTDKDIYNFIAAAKNPIAKPQAFTQDRLNLASADTILFRGRRKQIAKKMVQSVYTIPHCTHFEEIDMTELIHFRDNLKKRKQNLSITAFFLKVISVCLKEFPIFNARLDEENEVILLQNGHHIGLAVNTEAGLIVPVIKHIENKYIRQIDEEMKVLTEKAINDSFSIEDISGGTFTISNVGPLGGSFGATPIIQHPQVAIISFHKTKKMPIVDENNEIVIRHMMNISMSFDHRIADGATAVKFTNRFAQLIQDPRMLLLELV